MDFSGNPENRVFLAQISIFSEKNENLENFGRPAIFFWPRPEKIPEKNCGKNFRAQKISAVDKKKTSEKNLEFERKKR